MFMVEDKTNLTIVIILTSAACCMYLIGLCIHIKVIKVSQKDKEMTYPSTKESNKETPPPKGRRKGKPRRAGNSVHLNSLSASGEEERTRS